MYLYGYFIYLVNGITYRVVIGTAPPYIYELVDFDKPSRPGLRSANKTLLVQPKSSRSWGDIAPSLFSFAVALQSSPSNPYSRNISLNSFMSWSNLYFCLLYFP